MFEVCDNIIISAISDTEIDERKRRQGASEAYLIIIHY